MQHGWHVVASSEKLGRIPRLALALALALVALSILVLTTGSVVQAIRVGESREAVRLAAIGRLKTQQIAGWFAERRGDAEGARRLLLDTDAYRRWIGQGDPGSGRHLAELLHVYVGPDTFHAVLLADAGTRVLSTSCDTSCREPDLALPDVVARSRHDGRSRLTEPYLGGEGHVLLDLVTPVAEGASAGQPVMVFRIRTDDYLCQLLASWPEPSRTAQTLLFQRDGNDAVYLTARPCRPDPGSVVGKILRLPLAGPELIAARVLREPGRIGQVLDGIDHTGAAVMAVVLPVVGTDWFLVAEVGRDEVVVRVIDDALWILLVGFLTLVAATTLVLFLRHRQALMLALHQREAEAERVRVLGLLAAIVDNSEDSIFAKDLQGRYLLFNRATASYLGVAPEEVLGNDAGSLLSAEQAARTRDIEREILASGQRQVREEVFETTQGRRTWVVTRGPLLDGEGQVIGTFGIGRDVTERRQTESALLERLALQAQLVRIAASVPGVIFSWKRWPDRRSSMPFSTSMAEDLYGLSRKRLAEDMRILTQRIRPDDLRRLNVAVAEAGRQSILCHSEYRYLHPGKGWRWIEFWMLPQHDTDGGVIWHGFTMDVTDREQALEALRESEERNRLVFETSTDALTLLRPPSWYPVRANPAAVKMFGAHDETDFLARSLWERSPEFQPDGRSSREKAHAIRERALGVGYHCFEWQYRRLDGTLFMVSVMLTRFEMGGQTLLQSLARDITEQKAQERELRDSKAKLRELIAYREKDREDERGHIAREVHDELGQYLTALRMDTNLLQIRYGREDPELARKLQTMKQSIDHVIAETRRVITRLRPMALNLGIESAAEWLVEDYQRRTGVACQLQVASPDLDLHEDQATTLFRILQECLTNVARHARATRVDIRLHASQGVLRLQVSDDGRGFDPALVRNKKTFGLMGMRERLVIHGGSLEIDSRPGSGTRVEARLPIDTREVT